MRRHPGKVNEILAAHLVEHDALRLEPVPRPDMLERVDDLLPVGVLLVPELVGRKRQDDLHGKYV